MQPVVLDTNILVSGLIGKGTSRQIQKMISGRGIVPFFSSPVYMEYEDVLRRPKFTRYLNFAHGAIEILDDVREFGKVIEPEEHFHVCADPDDDKFIDIAVAGKVEYLITGNKRDFPPYSFRGVRIVSPSEFLSLSK